MSLEFDLGTVLLSEYDDDGFLGIQVDIESADGSDNPYEVYFPYGSLARPLDPDSNGLGCVAKYAKEGNKRYAWLQGDPRIADTLPRLKKGERIEYGPKGQFQRFHADGGWSVCTFLNGDPNSFSIFLKLSPTEGLIFESPWLRITAGPNGFHVKHSGGARIDLGSIAGLPPPLDTLSSYVSISAMIASINASAVSQGTDAGATNDTGVTTLGTLLMAMAVALDAKSGTPSTLTAAVTAALPAISQIGKVY